MENLGPSYEAPRVRAQDVFGGFTGQHHADDMHRRPFNLLRSFGLLSLASIVIVGIVSGIGVLQYMSKHMFEREATVSMQFIQGLIDSSDTALTDKAFGEPQEHKQLAHLLEHISLIPDVVRANVYGADLTLIWSTERNLIGSKFAFNPALEKALKGELVFERVRLSQTEKEEHAFFADDVDLVETYVPIWDRARSRIIGVAELYRTPAALFHAIEQSRLIVIIGGVVGGMLLYAALLWIVRRGRGLIHEQERRLENEISEHKRDKLTLKRSERALRVLSARLLTAQEQERKRIAAELHDGLGQSLSAIKFNLESSLGSLPPDAAGRGSEIIKKTITRVRDAVDEIRRISMDLRPLILDDLGILATIDWFSREFQRIYPHVKIAKRVTVAEEHVPGVLKIVIYRVMQEALNNVAKHAGASRVSLELMHNGTDLEFRIIDNGCGFDPRTCTGANEGRNKGIGLQSMRERAELTGGVLEIESSVGEGTRIEVLWPITFEAETRQSVVMGSLSACAFFSGPATFQKNLTDRRASDTQDRRTYATGK